jgi:hypothetical protein
MPDGKVRHPVTLYVDQIELGPDIEYGETIRTAYVLEITGPDAQKLMEYLQKRLEQHPVAAIRIKVIGRLVS